MSIETVKNKISSLSEEHKATGNDLDDFKDAELIEYEAEQLIIEYCEAKGYMVNGLPTQKSNCQSKN